MDTFREWVLCGSFDDFYSILPKKIPIATPATKEAMKTWISWNTMSSSLFVTLLNHILAFLSFFFNRLSALSSLRSTNFSTCNKVSCYLITVLAISWYCPCSEIKSNGFMSQEFYSFTKRVWESTNKSQIFLKRILKHEDTLLDN